VTAKPERARDRVADSGPRQLADALLIEAAALLGEVVVPQRLVIRVKEIADVGVEGIVNLILIAGPVECVERHRRTPLWPLSGHGTITRTATESNRISVTAEEDRPCAAPSCSSESSDWV
jgi:hypothetical protein